MPKKPARVEDISVDPALEGAERTVFFFPTIGQGVSVEATSYEEAMEKASKLK